MVLYSLKVGHFPCAEPEQRPPLQMILQLCCVSAIEGLDMGLLPAISLALQRDLSLRLTDLSVMTLGQAVALALAAPAWGVLADRKVLRRKTLLSMGALIQGCSTILLGFTQGFTMMLLLRITTGAMLASLKPLCVGLVADTTSETNRGKVGAVVFTLYTML